MITEDYYLDRLYHIEAMYKFKIMELEKTIKSLQELNGLVSTAYVLEKEKRLAIQEQLLSQKEAMIDREQFKWQQDLQYQKFLSAVKNGIL